MSDQERQRRLHVENRMAELNAKFGPIVDYVMPAWLDHYPEPEVPVAAPAPVTFAPPPTVRPDRKPAPPPQQRERVSVDFSDLDI